MRLATARPGPARAAGTTTGGGSARRGGSRGSRSTPGGRAVDWWAGGWERAGGRLGRRAVANQSAARIPAPLHCFLSEHVGLAGDGHSTSWNGSLTHPAAALHPRLQQAAATATRVGLRGAADRGQEARPAAQALLAEGAPPSFASLNFRPACCAHAPSSSSRAFNQALRLCVMHCTALARPSERRATVAATPPSKQCLPPGGQLVFCLASSPSLPTAQPKISALCPPRPTTSARSSRRWIASGGSSSGRRWRRRCARESVSC